MNKRRFLIFIGLIFTLLLLLLQSTHPISLTDSSNDVKISGNITKDISTIYIYEDFYSDWDFTSKTNSTTQLQANSLFRGLNMSLFSIHVAARDFKTNETKYIIANNTNNITSIGFPNAIAYAQQFTLNRPTYIEYLSIFINYSKGNAYYDLYLDFYRDLNNEPINMWQIISQISPHYVGWINFSVWLYFRPDTYYFVITYTPGIGGMTPNKPIIYFQANTSSNAGQTKYNDGSQWNLVNNDENVDLLSKFYLYYYYTKNELNMTLKINDQIIELDTFESPWDLSIEKMYYLPQQPTGIVNIFFSINQTNKYGHIDIRARYFGTVNASGTFKITDSTITSNIKYFVNSTIGMNYYLMYPGSWNLIDVYNSYGNKLEEFMIGKFKIYGKIYWGIFDWMMSSEGIYTANFTIPNFLSSIELQIQEENYQANTMVQVGQTFRISASIMDSSGNPMDDGICNITLVRPDGIQMVINSFLNNGVLLSDIISTSNWKEGTCKATIFWTDGAAFGYITYSFSVVKISFPWIILFAVLGVVGAAIPASFYVKRKIEERNWEKSLLYIFGLTKDGGSIFGKTFRLELQDPALISGMIAAITNFVTETMKSKKALRVIDHEDKKVLLSHGPNYIIALMAEKDLNIIRKKLDKFSEEFGKQYGSKIDNWKGDTKTFKGVESIIEKYFPLTQEDKIKLGVSTKLKELKELLLTTSEQSDIIAILKEISSLTLKYKEIIKTYFAKEYDELLKIADEKINPA